MALKNTILDGDEFFEHQNALKLAKTSYFHAFVLLIGVLVISFLEPFGIAFNFVFWIAFIVSSFLKMLYESNKYSYVYFYNWEEPNLTLYITNIFGKTKQVSFAKNSIKHAKVLKFLSTQKGTLILKTYSQDYKFTLLGAKVLSELPPIIEQN